jgi:hypothetical protein
MGACVVALGQSDDLHGLTFACVGEQVGDQLPSTFLEPQDGGALLAFGLINVEVPSAAALTAHCAQAAAPLLMPHNAAGVDTELTDVCMIPLVWGPCFIGGGTPKETCDKIELLIAAVPAADRDACESIQQWGRCLCVAAGNLGQKSTSLAQLQRGGTFLGEPSAMHGPKDGSRQSAVCPRLRVQQHQLLEVAPVRTMP